MLGRLAEVFIEKKKKKRKEKKRKKEWRKGNERTRKIVAHK